MKIAVSQLNYHIGNFDYNAEKIISTAKKAKSQNADLVVFSELSVCGYCPNDLLERTDFLEKCNDTISHIASECRDIALIIGTPVQNNTGVGKKLFNSALFIADGKIKTFSKTLLPTYDIFDEYRYFESNDNFEILEYKGERIAITICEDLWDEQRTYGNFKSELLYKNSPMEILSQFNPDFVINIAASPYSYSHNVERLNILLNNAIRYSLPIVYVNQVGANTDLIFDGGSVVVNKCGELILECNHFEEDLQIIDSVNFNKNGKCVKDILYDKTEEYFNALTLGIKDYFSKMGFKKAVLGLSGGIDSAVVLALTIQALGSENVHSILMPTCYSSSHSVDDSLEMLKRTKSTYNIIPIEDLRVGFGNAMKEAFDGTKEGLAEENIQARLRGSILMAYSNKFGNILLNTSNKSEEAVGYSTLYGDMNGSLSVLGDVYKTDVYKLARYINKNCGNIIPENIITKAPSAELRPDQKDQDSLPPYDILDEILYSYIEKKMSAQEIKNLGFNSETVDFIIRLVTRVEYKRFQAPPILRVSSKAFGAGWKMPLVAKY